jgi:hypothetical protein
MRLLTRILTGLSFMFFLGACSKEDPQPEIRDPIYNDLASRTKTLDEDVKSLTEKLTSLKINVQNAEPNTLAGREVARDLRKHQKMLREAVQALTYYRIRLDRRKLVDKLTYRDAYLARREWPDPSEFRHYQISLRLKEANRNWGARVPRLADRTPSSLNQKIQAAKTSQPEGQGEE